MKVSEYCALEASCIRPKYNIVLRTDNKHFNLACSIGELALQDTLQCQLNGYTCTNGDGARCCDGREDETRRCVPCDETRHKKPNGMKYVTPGNCEFDFISEVPGG